MDSLGRAGDRRFLAGAGGACVRPVRAAHAGGRSLHIQGLGCSITRAGPGGLHGAISLANVPEVQPVRGLPIVRLPTGLVLGVARVIKGHAGHGGAVAAVAAAVSLARAPVFCCGALGANGLGGRRPRR
eukprot:2409987-Lingulodinium_polyedra.AAC.1